MSKTGGRGWSIERHLVLVLGSVLGALWLVAAAATILLTRHEINEVFDSALQETAQRLLPLAVHDLHEVADGSRDSDDQGESLSEEFDRSDAYLTYQVRDASGRVLLRSHDAPADGFPVALARGFASDGPLRIYTEASRNERLFVQVADLVDRRSVAIRQILAWLALPLVALVLASGVAVKLILRNATRPLLKLQEDIRSRDGSNLSPLPADRLPEELLSTVDAVNRLMSRLARVLDSERTFAANSAHELRTPLAAAQAQAQLLADDLKGRREGTRAKNLLALLGRLSRLVEKLLQLSRAEAGVAMAGTCDAESVARVVVDEYRSRTLGASNPVEIAVASGKTSDIAIDQDALGIVLHNLIDNALAHGAAGTPVRVVLGPGPTISVANSSPVVAAENMPKLRERFSRGETVAEGSGLGLSIIDTIMRQTGGRLDLHSPARDKSDGFEVVLTFRKPGTVAARL